MRVDNLDTDPHSLHQLIIADRELGFKQKDIAQRRGCAQSTVSQVLAAERLRRLKAELDEDTQSGNTSETAMKAIQAAEQVKQALAYVRSVERRLKAIHGLLAQLAADENAQNGADKTGKA